MSAVFAELDIDSMTVTDAALRDGVFYDLIGRQLNEDMREQTIAHLINLKIEKAIPLRMVFLQIVNY